MGRFGESCSFLFSFKKDSNLAMDLAWRSALSTQPLGQWVLGRPGSPTITTLNYVGAFWVKL